MQPLRHVTKPGSVRDLGPVSTDRLVAAVKQVPEAVW